MSTAKIVRIEPTVSQTVRTPVAFGQRPEQLADILFPECAIAIWTRGLPAAAVAALAALAPDELDDWQAVVAVDDADADVALLLGAAGYPLPTGRWLARDIAALATTFARIANCARLRLRLDWIEGDACRRFHADAGGLRLLTTYRGRGTQWRCAGEADDAARALAPGEVAILKGRDLASHAPVLHRSPPIGGTGERRLLLVIDAA